MTVVYGQNIIDVALQISGKAESIFELAELNDISISEVLSVGQNIKPIAIQDLDTVQFFMDRDFTVVTGNDTLPQYTGDFGGDFSFDFGQDFNS